MATVYSEKGGTLQVNTGVLSQDDKEGTYDSGLSTPSNPKQMKAEDRGAVTGSRLGSPTTSKNHAEIVGINAMPPITIKEEQIEDEEYLQINLSDVGAGSEERAADDDGDESVHEENVDVKLRSMRCQDCGQQFTRWEAFKIHLRKHVEEEVEKERTATKRTLQPQGQNSEKKKRGDKDEDGEDDIEEEEEEDEEEFFDSTCQIKPSEIAKVRPRVAMLSQEEKPVYGSSNRVYACSVCGKVYSYLESFRNHQKTHTDAEMEEKSYQCRDCGKTFVRAMGLTMHMKVHRTTVVESKPAQLHCDQCNKSFNSSQTWLEHKEIHKTKPFWCLSCTKGFKDAESLDRHLLRHDLKRHRCDICFKSFRVPAELRYHYNTHMGFKPYKCNFCSKDFSQLGNLITHRKKHLGVCMEGTSNFLGQTSKCAGPRKVTVMKKLVIGRKGVVKTPEEFLWRASNKREGKEGAESGSNIEDEYNEEGTCVDGIDEDSESKSASDPGKRNVGNNSEDSGSGFSANSDLSEEGDEAKWNEEVGRTGHGAVQREDGHYKEVKEEPEDIELVSQETSVQQEGEWRCFECGSSFFQEPELHLHYMKHASGEL